MLDTDANNRPPPVHEHPTWLTIAQAGEYLGLSPEAVLHRARRFGWRTQPGNDGRTLVMVPEAEMAEAAPASARPQESEAGHRLTAIEAWMGGVENRLTSTIAAEQNSHELSIMRIADTQADHTARLTRIEAKLDAIEAALASIATGLP